MTALNLSSAGLDILLIMPQLGSFDNIIRDIPLSLIYAATDTVKKGYRVRILDLRLQPAHWQEQIDAQLAAGCALVGVSVMTGNPIRTALRISQYIQEKYTIPVVWGGAHPTILPEQTLENEYVDYVIRDYGSRALCQLVEYLKGEPVQLPDILGLGYKQNGQIRLSPVQTSFEMLDYRDLPYALVDINSQTYSRLGNGELLLPIYTAMGCPYQCAFCMSPAVYKKIVGKKVVHYSNEAVLDHIAFLLEHYHFQRLQVYDDDSFVDLPKLRDLLTRYIGRGFHLKLKLDFRGARINELDKLDDDFLNLMVTAGVEMLAIGAESGSDASLLRMNKAITVEQTVRVNQKLAKFPSLRPHYNLFCGIPGDTYEDLLLTKDLMLRLVAENPHCYLGVGADWKPLPGSTMTEVAVRDYSLQLPQSLIAWAEIDSIDAQKIVHPWYTPQMDNMIKLLQVAGNLLDSKLKDFREAMGWLGWLVTGVLLLYRPILNFRLKHNFTGAMLEYDARALFFRIWDRYQHMRSKLAGKAPRRKGI